MSFLAALIGLLIFPLGVAIVLSPTTLRTAAHYTIQQGWLYWATSFRVLLGGILFTAAVHTRMPGFIKGLGVFLIATGITISILGEKRVESIAGWWSYQPNVVLGVWGAAVTVVGALVIWASLS